MSNFLSAGRLEDHPFAELSGLIFQESRTGELTLEHGERRRTVWFLGGNPVAVVSHDPAEHLGRFLLEHGKISEDEARRLADLPETREALGTADFLPKETLNWGVKSRFVNLCYDLFRWEDGDYSFREGDPPRELFLLKVPAHSLIFKGVGLLGQTAVIDAVPDDAVCAAGSVAAADARYLSPEALRLLEQCRPGVTVTEALETGSVDRDQSRRLLYALACLGLVTLARGPAGATKAPPVQDEGPGFILDGDDFTPAPPEPAPPESHAEGDDGGFSLDDQHGRGEFSLDLPPLTTPSVSPSEPDSEHQTAGAAEPAGRYPFEEEPGAGPFGSFGSFNPDTPLDDQDEQSTPSDDVLGAAGKTSKPSGRRFHLPRIVGITLGSLAAAGIIGFAGWWWMSGSEPPPPPVKAPVKRPAPATVAPAPAPGPIAQPAAPAPSPAPAPLSSPASPAPPPLPTAAPAPAPPAPAPVAGVPAPRPPAGVSAGSATDRYRKGFDSFRSGDLAGAAAIWEALLAEEHRGGFTVQLLTACQHDTVRDAQRSIDTQDMYLVTKKVNGRACYRVCVGVFESREAAARALAGLPGTFRAGGASVRTVTDVLSRDR
jgi:hypothetical protein